jgi:hypothetical protein
MTAHDIFGAVFGVVIATIFLVIAINCVRSGKSGPTINLPEISANRASSPKLYWMFQAAYGAIAAMGLSLTILFCTNAVLAAISAALFFGVGLAIMGAATCFYTFYGFRSGKALLIYQGVSIFDRDQSPRWYWATQIQNIVVTGFFGAAGLGAITFAIWVEFSS